MLSSSFALLKKYINIKRVYNCCNKKFLKNIKNYFFHNWPESSSRALNL